MTSLDIKIFLLREGITQKQIADHLGVHKTFVTFLLSGVCRTDCHLDAIAAYLGISRRKLDRMITKPPTRKAA